MFIAALFMVEKTWKQLKWKRLEEWINTMLYIFIIYSSEFCIYIYIYKTMSSIYTYIYIYVCVYIYI